jgi:hypothetical protein
MCVPCWLGVKRSLLAHIAAQPVGEVFSVPLVPGYPEKCEMVRKVSDPDGTLIYLHLKATSIFRYGGVRVLWYPTYGGGGWVDEVKAPLIGNIRKQMEAERDASNCMAL